METIEIHLVPITTHDISMIQPFIEKLQKNFFDAASADLFKLLWSYAVNFSKLDEKTNECFTLDPKKGGIEDQIHSGPGKCLQLIELMLDSLANKKHPWPGTNASFQNLYYIVRARISAYYHNKAGGFSEYNNNAAFTNLHTKDACFGNVDAYLQIPAIKELSDSIDIYYEAAHKEDYMEKSKSNKWLTASLCIVAVFVLLLLFLLFKMFFL
jgi:hypothetical protein